MTFPKISRIRKPLLEFLAKDRNYHSLDECVAHLGNYFDLTEEEKQKRQEGNQKRKIFQRSVTYVISDFRIAQLIDDEVKPGGASFRINQTGLELLERDHDVITKKILKRFGDYSSLDKKIIPQEDKIDEEKTEEEEFEVLKDQYAERMQIELLQHIKNRCSSRGFEKLCLKLLEEMGYGESEHTGKSGDRGVDGIIYADKFGLRKIYVQTKKHDQGTVPYDKVTEFYGKCVRDKVQGIFITTSNFSDNTINEMERESIIKLINGTELVKYLYQFNVGVELESKIELKQINLNELDSFN